MIGNTYAVEIADKVKPKMDKTDEMLQLLDADHVIHVADAGISAEAAPDGRSLGHTRCRLD